MSNAAGQERSRVMIPYDAMLGLAFSLDGVIHFRERRNALRRSWLIDLEASTTLPPRPIINSVCRS